MFGWIEWTWAVFTVFPRQGKDSRLSAWMWWSLCLLFHQSGPITCRTVSCICKVQISSAYRAERHAALYAGVAALG